MEISIMSRNDAIDFARKNKGGSYAVISINDCGAPPPELTTEGNGINFVCYLQFDDVLQGQDNCITAQDAGKIAAFIKSLDKANINLIVHCEFGQSRSAGVAAAVSLAVNGDDAWVFNNRRYYPNITCYKKVLEAFNYKNIILQVFKRNLDMARMAEAKDNIIFLDVEGVININDAFSEPALANLRKLAERTDAGIVISSSWRFYKPGTPSHDELSDVLKRYGLLERLIGHTNSNPLRTYELRGADFGQGQGKVRCKNVFLWLTDNWDKYDIGAFVILDDLNHMGIFNRYLARCNPAKGLTDAVCQRAVKILSSPVSREELSVGSR
jgi:predicted protein tyrosine phosphatase